MGHKALIISVNAGVGKVLTVTNYQLSIINYQCPIPHAQLPITLIR